MALPFYLPTDTRCNVQAFTVPSTVTNVQWHTWTRPAACTMTLIVAIGGGAGGGGGASGGGGGGGGGGGSSGQARLLIPSILLPDSLYVQVGAGGSGAAAAGTGSSGVLSYVSVYSDTTAQNLVMSSGAAAAAGGVNGNFGAGGAGGAASTIATVGALGGMGIFQAVAGDIGGSGGNNAASGTAKAIPTTSVQSTGGTGGSGSGVSLLGGAITSVASTLLSEIRPIANTTNLNGTSSPMIWKPYWAWGGLGAGDNSPATGLVGGNAPYGAGGGGGSAGTATGGKGGDGGCGLVLFVSW